MKEFFSFDKTTRRFSFAAGGIAEKSARASGRFFARQKSRRLAALTARQKSYGLRAAAFCAALAFLFAACANFGGDISYDALSQAGAAKAGASQGQIVSRDVTANVFFADLPQIAAQSAEAAGADTGAAQTFGISKSAFPSAAQLAGATYSFSAVLASATGGTSYSATGTYDSGAGTCSFAFAGALSESAASYTLTVTLIYTSGTPAVQTQIASGTKSVSLAALASSFSANVTLAPKTDSGINGALSLPIQFSDTSVSSVQVQLMDSSGTDVAATYLGGSSLSLAGGSGTIASVAAGLPAGAYTLLMTFKKGSQAVGSRTESLNVYPSLLTNAWWTNGASSDTLNITKYEQTEFWVRGTGGKFYTEVFTTAAEASDDNSGSFASPLATIQAAVDKIAAASDGTTQYTVYLDGKVTAQSDNSAYSSNNKAFVNIGTNQNILIKGWTGSGTDIIDVNRTADTKGVRGLYIRSGSTVALQKIAITGGAADNYGGAVYALTGSSLKIDSCALNSNYASNGGAVYLTGSASFTMEESDILNNTASASGGGIYKGNTATLVVKSGSIRDNTAISGGGIYSGGAAEKTMLVIGQTDSSDTPEISGNTSTGTSSGGGGIYATGCIDIQRADIKDNTAKNGGGIYIGSSSSADAEASLANVDISGNTASARAGGVYASGSRMKAQFTSGVISDNNAADGGGVYVDDKAKFYMSGDSRIAKNTASTYGGGVYNRGIFCMSGAAIVGADPAGLSAPASEDDHSNYASSGGGVYTLSSSTAKFYFGYVDESTSDTSFSGGVYYNYAKSGGGICANGDFVMERGSVSYNALQSNGNGGGVYIGVISGRFTMTGGEISHNATGGNGGGISVGSSSVYISGGRIFANSASGNGGGVYANTVYLYGTAVIGDKDASSAATETDCSNKAKAGGGVYASNALLGYSSNSAQAEWTGGIYKNYATSATSANYGGGGICVVSQSASMAFYFKMASGTISHNAAACGGGLYIQGSNSYSASERQISGGSFASNAADYGGAIYNRLTNGLGAGGSVYMPSATGAAGDNDVYQYPSNSASGVYYTLNLVSAFSGATPVLTLTPATYAATNTVLKSDNSSLLESERSKIAVAPNGDEVWAIDSSGKLYKPTSEVYISASGSDSAGDGTKEKPYASVDKAVQAFTEAKPAFIGSAADPTFVNKVYVLSDYTFTKGAGTSREVYFELSGCKGGTAGSAVTLTFNTPSDSGFYVPSGQKAKFKNIKVTQDTGACPTNNYAAIIVAAGGEFFMEDSSISGMNAKSCSAIQADGDVHLKNVSITENTAIAQTGGDLDWGPAVFSKQGTIHLLGAVKITDNKMNVDGALKTMNVWIGDKSTGTTYYNSLAVDGAITGSSVGVTLYDPSVSVFTSGYAEHESDEPASYFASDEGMDVILDSGEAKLAPPSSLYVSQTGSDATGNGSQAAPFASVNKAVTKINGFSDASADYTIYVDGTIAAATSISALTAKSLSLRGVTGSASDVLDGSGYSYPVLFVGTAADITLMDITLTGGTGYPQSGNVSLGGGIMVNSTGANITLKSGSVVSGNSATQGGGIFINGGTVTLDGGTITNNNATSNGGGVRVNQGSFIMKSGEIASNGAAKGGGVYTTATFTMQGGDILGNTATDGSGVYVYASGSAIGSFSMSGGATVNSNNDVYLMSASCYVAIAGTLSASSAATITPNTYAAGRKVLDGTDALVSANYGKFAVTPDGSDEWEISSSGTLKKKDNEYSVNTSGVADILAAYAGSGETVTLKIDDVTASNITTLRDALMANSDVMVQLDLSDSGLTKLPDSAFFNATSFTGCANLTEVTLPDGMTEIGMSAFAGCTNLKEVEIPDTVTAIGISAFNGCSSLTEIEIPASVRTIGAMAFWGAGLTSAKFETASGVSSVWNLQFMGNTATYNPPSKTNAQNAEALTATYANRLWTRQ